MDTNIIVNRHKIGLGEPVYIIAELSANHNQDFDQAAKLIYAAKNSGADAVKIQTYTPDTLTIDCDNDYFLIGKGTTWEGKNLYELYSEAYTPWEWQPKLQTIARELEIDFFSTPFDFTAVDYLEKMDVPAYKIASFELPDLELIKYIAQTGKPIIMSTGMATISEIDEAVRTAIGAGATSIALLKCNSAYPSPPEEMNLRTIPHMADTFNLPVGLSDHSLELAVPITAVAFGACIIEKHFTLNRRNIGPDSAFSLDPDEFKAMVKAVRTAEKAKGTINYNMTSSENASRDFCRSLFVVKDMKVGDVFTRENLRAIRPSFGLPPKFLEKLLGMRVTQSVKRGTPMSWELVG